MDHIRSDMMKHDVRFEKVNLELASIEFKKVSVDCFRELEKRVNSFTELEHIEFLKNVLFPKMEDFAAKIDFFH